LNSVRNSDSGKLNGSDARKSGVGSLEAGPDILGTDEKLHGDEGYDQSKCQSDESFAENAPIMDDSLQVLIVHSLNGE
jgi:hypothetical protein